MVKKFAHALIPGAAPELRAGSKLTCSCACWSCASFYPGQRPGTIPLPVRTAAFCGSAPKGYRRCSTRHTSIDWRNGILTAFGRGPEVDCLRTTRFRTARPTGAIPQQTTPGTEPRTTIPGKLLLQPLQEVPRLMALLAGNHRGWRPQADGNGQVRNASRGQQERVSQFGMGPTQVGRGGAAVAPGFHFLRSDGHGTSRLPTVLRGAVLKSSRCTSPSQNQPLMDHAIAGTDFSPSVSWLRIGPERKTKSAD